MQYEKDFLVKKFGDYLGVKKQPALKECYYTECIYKQRLDLLDTLMCEIFKSKDIDEELVVRLINVIEEKKKESERLDEEIRIKMEESKNYDVAIERRYSVLKKLVALHGGK